MLNPEDAMKVRDTSTEAYAHEQQLEWAAAIVKSEGYRVVKAKPIWDGYKVIGDRIVEEL